MFILFSLVIYMGEIVRSMLFIIVVILIFVIAAVSLLLLLPPLLLLSFFLFWCFSFYNYMTWNWREKKLIYEKNCICIEYDRTPMEMNTYLLICLNSLDEYQINCRLVVSVFFGTPSSWSSIYPTKDYNTCTSNAGQTPCPISSHINLISLSWFEIW